MNKKSYYFVMLPIIIIGFYLTYHFPASKTYVLLTMVVVGSYFSWEEFREKSKKAEGEEELRRVSVPFILLIVFLVIFIIDFLM